MKTKQRRPPYSVDPASLYPSPQALAADAGLTRRQRIRLLRRWAFEERCQEVATGEGMKGSSEGRLSEISQLLANLESSDDTAPSDREARDAMPSGPPSQEPMMGWSRRPRLAILLALAGAYAALTALLIAFDGSWRAIAAATIGAGLVGLLILVRRERYR